MTNHEVQPSTTTVGGRGGGGGGVCQRGQEVYRGGTVWVLDIVSETLNAALRVNLLWPEELAD